MRTTTLPGEGETPRLSDRLAPLVDTLSRALKQDGMDAGYVLLSVALGGDVSGASGFFGPIGCQKALIAQLLLSIDRSIDNLAKATGVEPDAIMAQVEAMMRKQPDFVRGRFYHLPRDPDAEREGC